MRSVRYASADVDDGCVRVIGSVSALVGRDDTEDRKRVARPFKLFFGADAIVDVLAYERRADAHEQSDEQCQPAGSQRTRLDRRLRRRCRPHDTGTAGSEREPDLELIERRAKPGLFAQEGSAALAH